MLVTITFILDPCIYNIKCIIIPGQLTHLCYLFHLKGIRILFISSDLHDKKQLA